VIVKCWVTGKKMKKEKKTREQLEPEDGKKGEDFRCFGHGERRTNKAGELIWRRRRRKNWKRDRTPLNSKKKGKHIVLAELKKGW